MCVQGAACNVSPVTPTRVPNRGIYPLFFGVLLAQPALMWDGWDRQIFGAGVVRLNSAGLCKGPSSPGAAQDVPFTKGAKWEEEIPS